MTKREYDDRRRFIDRIADAVQPRPDGGPDYGGRVRARELADLLCRHGRSYARVQEACCNGVGTWYGESNDSFTRRQRAHEEWTEKRDAQLEKRITAIVAELGEGFTAVFQGDPRGHTVRVRLPGQREDDAVGVPTS